MSFKRQGNHIRFWVHFGFFFSLRESRISVAGIYIPAFQKWVWNKRRGGKKQKASKPRAWTLCCMFVLCFFFFVFVCASLLPPPRLSTTILMCVPLFPLPAFPASPSLAAPLSFFPSSLSLAPKPAACALFCRPPFFTARWSGVRGAEAACRSSRCRPVSRRRRGSAAGSPVGSSVSLSASDCKTKP